MFDVIVGVLESIVIITFLMFWVEYFSSDDDE